MGGRNIGTAEAPMGEREVKSMMHDSLPMCSIFSGEIQEKGFGKWDAPTSAILNEMTSHFLRRIRVATPIVINFHHFVVVAASRNMRLVLDTLWISN